jgi:hypothetical protein
MVVRGEFRKEENRIGGGLSYACCMVDNGAIYSKIDFLDKRKRGTKKTAVPELRTDTGYSASSCITAI